MRTVFFISDRTGITAEALGNSLLTQFPEIEFKRVNLAFIDSLKKAKTVANLIQEASQTDGQPALIFSTQVSNEYQKLSFLKIVAGLSLICLKLLFQKWKRRLMQNLLMRWDYLMVLETKIHTQVGLIV